MSENDTKNLDILIKMQKDREKIINKNNGKRI